MTDPFWEAPDVVERFASRDPDHRLVELIGRYSEPAGVRVLDVGCAGGRNTDLLVRRGFDVHALDAARAMVERSRARIAPLVGREEAAARVRVGRMDELSAYADGAFELVVALGVHHSARSREEWERSVAELARVLRPDGRLLFSQFTPETDLTGEGIVPVPGEPGVYDGFPSGRAVLLTAGALDAALAKHGFEPLEPTATVRVDLERGRRVSANGLYVRVPGRPV